MRQKRLGLRRGCRTGVGGPAWTQGIRAGGSRSPCPAVYAVQLGGRCWGHPEGAALVTAPGPLPQDQGHCQPTRPLLSQKVSRESLGEVPHLTGSCCLRAEVAFTGLIRGLAPQPCLPEDANCKFSPQGDSQGPWRDCEEGYDVRGGGVPPSPWDT